MSRGTRDLYKLLYFMSANVFVGKLGVHKDFKFDSRVGLSLFSAHKSIRMLLSGKLVRVNL